MYKYLHLDAKVKVGHAQCKRAEECRDLEDFLVEIHYILIFKYASIDHISFLS